jgi:hypothetical protein
MDDYYTSSFYNRADPEGKGNGSCCHYEQYLTAKQIVVDYIKGSRQVLLAAQMQSGKTGVYLSLAIMMIMTNTVKRVVIICGSNDVKLHAQLAGGMVDGEMMKGDIKTAIDAFVKMLPDDRKEEVAARLTEAIKAYKSSDLRNKRMVAITSESLVIWDESHFAQSVDNWPAKFLASCGLSVGGTARGDDKWATKSSFFLSVSATPFAEFSSTHGSEKERVTRSIVIHEPAEAYVGVMDFKEVGAILPSFRVKGHEDEFTALLTPYVTQKKYALIRSRNLNIVEACCRAAGVAYKKHYGKIAAGGDIKKALNGEPECFTVVGLKGMCRMGEVIPKEHIAFVFEEAKKSKTDTLLQSLLGRMCGHNRNKDTFLAQIKIYVPECFTYIKESDKYDISELNRYLRFTVNGIITPLKANCMGPKPKHLGLLILPPRWVPFDLTEDADPTDVLGPRAARAVQTAVGGAGVAVDDDEDDSDYEDEGDADDSDSEGDPGRHTLPTPNSIKSTRMCAAATAILRTQPYADERQQAEALRNVIPTKCSFHDLGSKSYTYVRGTGDKKSPGIYDHFQKNTRWEDRWKAPLFKLFKLYMVKRSDVFNHHGQDGFYIVGYTEDGNADTLRECRNHIIPINSKCAFHPDADLADDEVIRTFPLFVVRNDSDANEFLALPVASQRFVSVSREYSKTPRGRMLQQSLQAVTARTGNTGPKLGSKKRTELGIPKNEKFDRFVMLPGISFTIDIKGGDTGITVSIKVNDGAGNTLFDTKATFPIGTPFSFNMSIST